MSPGAAGAVVYEQATSVYNVVYTQGDIFRIERKYINNNYWIIYSKNGVALRTVSDPNPSASMVVDITIGRAPGLNQQGCKVYNLVVGKKKTIPVYDPSDYISYINYEDYRYAYNGMEQDNEVSGNGNSYTTEFRQYDPRLGRWKSLDPLMAIQPFQSPYQAFKNNPVFFIDPLGLIGGPTQEKLNLDFSSSKGNGGDSWCSDCNKTKRSTRTEKGINGMNLHIPNSYNYESQYNMWGEKTKQGTMVRIDDFDGNGYIGNSETGVKYKGAEAGQIYSFTGQDGLTYTAIFNKKGNFKGYWTGSGFNRKKYINTKVTDRDIIEEKIEQGLDYLGNSEYGDKPPNVDYYKNIYISEFTIRGKTFKGEASFNVASDFSGRIKTPRDLNNLYLSKDDKGSGSGSAFKTTGGWQVRIMSYVGGYYSLDDVITIVFREKAEYVRFVKFIGDEFNITDGNQRLTDTSEKPSRIIGGK